MGLPTSAPAADYTLTSDDMYVGNHHVNPGAAINADLPEAGEDVDFWYWNVGATHAITIRKPGPVTLVVLAAGQRAHIQTYVDASGVPQYATFQAYTPTNVTTDRAFDADTVVVAELADVVGTLIADLQAGGMID